MSPLPEKPLLKIRRYFHPGEWSARLLGLPRSQGTASSLGLVLIQIDGFSKKELEKALDHGEMPCLKRLLTREHYRLYPHYPGLPSSTPAVQGELFYGQPQCVPAFFYYDRDTQKPIQMFTGADVEEVEKNLAGHTKGLLEGGSSYANIFSGGAQECHFCACSLGWDKVWKDVNPVNFILLCMTHFWAFLRMTWLTFLELVLACGDFFYGIARGENFRTEFRFIPIRASICILLRELVTVGAKIDVARGLPVVHLNFLGYDELAHRRGPSSKSAHWSLRGIDQCIANIYHSALHSTRRHYDVWVYSDHGQEETVLYPPKHGRSVNEAIEEVYDHIMGQYHPKEKSAGSPPHNIGHRVRYLGGIFQHLLLPQEQNDSYHKELVVVAKGVIGHVYLARPMTGEEKNIFAQEMVKSAQVPMVLAGEGENKIRVWNQKGQYLLPEQAQEVLGSDHPYLDQVTADLIKICRHPKAGDFVICGLRPDRTYDNFVLEHGDHGGPGINETDAFAILPAGMKIFPSDRSFLLTKDLRQAALHVLGRSGLKENKNNRDHKVKETIRIMTYNVHSCMGMDGKVSAQRVARVISRYEPDIIALQELDLSRSRSGSEDQPYIIAHHLEMLYHFHPSIQIEEQQYGNAILSRYPMQIKRAGVLPALSKRPVLEPRGALWAEITVGSQNLQLIASHLSLFHLEGLKQIEALLGKEWLLHPECRGPVILCGDFNATPASPVCRNIKKVLRDAQEQIEEHSPKPTWLSHYPVGRIDHVFVSPDIKVVGAQVPKNEFNKMVSDHLPLIVDISIKRPEAFFGVP